MSYIEDSLLNDEKILYVGKLHWIVFAWSHIWFVLALLFFLVNPYDNPPTLGILLFLLSGITGLMEFINFKTSEFGVTSKRIILKTGFIRRKSLEVMLNKVEGVQIDQGILGRILGYGTITIGGTGGTKSPFRCISNPLEFRRKTQEQIAIVQETKNS